MKSNPKIESCGSVSFCLGDVLLATTSNFSTTSQRRTFARIVIFQVVVCPINVCCLFVTLHIFYSKYPPTNLLELKAIVFDDFPPNSENDGNSKVEKDY